MKHDGGSSGDCTWPCFPKPPCGLNFRTTSRLMAAMATNHHFPVSLFRLKERRVFFPTLGVEELDFKLNSSPRPVYSSLIHGVPNPRVCLECQPQSVPGAPNPKLSLELECLAPECMGHGKKTGE